MTFFADCTETTIEHDDVKLFARVRGLENSSSTQPIIVCLHGYPQSSYLFRYITEYIPSPVPLFIPDLPGYGDSIKSTPTITTASYSKRSIGNSILSCLAQLLSLSPSSPPQPILLFGHDRGARIIHRLIVDAAHPHFTILGAALCDIVPITTQFVSFANPQHAASTFHWSLLAAPHPIPERMISALSGQEWVESCLTTWHGGRPIDKDAVEVYKNHFAKQSVIDASCADYRAAALVDAPQEEEDQKAGRKISVPVLCVYSKTYLGARYDVGKVWQDWVHDKEKLEVRALDEGIGHFLFEEDPKRAYNAVWDWVVGLGVGFEKHSGRST